MLPALEAEAKKRQVAHLKQGDESPVTPNSEQRDESGAAAKIAAKIVGTGKTQIYEAKRVKESNKENRQRPGKDVAVSVSATGIDQHGDYRPAGRTAQAARR
jgi:hypothetical protein